jgi:hypothetical protein
MKTAHIIITSVFLVLVISTFIAPALAQNEEDGDYEIRGFELEKLLFMLNAWIALFLFVIAFIAYHRDGRKRIFFVALAFLLFAAKNFMVSSGPFIPEIAWFEPTSVILEFAALLSLFYGVLKK